MTRNDDGATLLFSFLRVRAIRYLLEIHLHLKEEGGTVLGPAER